MIRLIKYVFGMVLLGITVGVNAQLYSEIPKTFTGKLAEFDSVLLVYYTPTYGMLDSLRLSGFGVKDDSVIRVNIFFIMKGKFYPNEAIFKSIEREVVGNKVIEDSIRHIQFSSIALLNKDSLAEPDRCGASISDASTSEILLIKANTLYHLSCYQPEFYQHFCPNKDRGVFLEFRQKVERLLKSSN